MRIMRFAPAAIASVTVAAVLSGCSAGSPASQEEVVSSPSVAVAETSTVAQWASLIAQQQAEWDEWVDDWEGNDCSALTAASEVGLICRVQLTSAMFMAQTTTIEHELAVTPGKRGFIAADPPAEISSLFAQTKTAARNVADGAEEWDAAGCSTSVGGDCASLTVSFDRSIDELTKAYVGWTPYM
jgi:hypothetical protein